MIGGIIYCRKPIVNDKTPKQQDISQNVWVFNAD